MHTWQIKNETRRSENYIETRLVDFLHVRKGKNSKMPIQVKDFVWEETDETVLITVPLKGVPTKRVDIFSVDDYIKVC